MSRRWVSYRVYYIVVGTAQILLCATCHKIDTLKIQLIYSRGAGTQVKLSVAASILEKRTISAIAH